MTTRYADGWEFDGRSDEYLRETFDLWAADTKDRTGVYQSGMRAIIEECHARAIEFDQKRSIVRACLSIPSDVELSAMQIEQAYDAYMVGRDETNPNVPQRGNEVLGLSITNAVTSVPVKLCSHGIDAARRCSICSEDEPKRGTLTLHTAGELHLNTNALTMIASRFTFTLNLSDLLDDPAHKPNVDLVQLDGTDSRVEDFVFATDGALGLYEDMLTLINRQLERGKDVDVMIMCRGGRHRSVAFGENLASHFWAPVMHHHKHLDVVTR